MSSFAEERAILERAKALLKENRILSNGVKKDDPIYPTQLFSNNIAYDGMPHSNIGGFILNSEPQNVYLNKNHRFYKDKNAQAHEAEHSLQGRQKDWTRNMANLMGALEYQHFTNGLHNARKKLADKYPMADNAYMADPGRVPLHELFASLSALEQQYNVDLTKTGDLEMFENPRYREFYRAMTGLRNTQTDPRDIPGNTLDHKAGKSSAIQEMNSPTTQFQKLVNFFKNL